LAFLHATSDETPMRTGRHEAEEALSAARERMVRDHLVARGIHDTRVLAAFRSVPRERFVPPALYRRAYDDEPLPIGQGQTISQPFIVALMTQLLELSGGERVLEIGTGSGYQTAILAELAAHVYSVEIIASLSAAAQERLALLDYRNVSFRVCDGTDGWPEHAPFDRVLLTAAPRQLPDALRDQLAEDGHLVAPLGTLRQTLQRFTRRGDAFRAEYHGEVSFVPMTGRSLDA
jgi:protein-L-isoaspartate(D-aspartate) O-methyltransferase